MVRDPGNAAWLLRQNPKIRQAIAERSELLEVDKLLLAKRIVEEWCRIAFYDVRKLYDQDGFLRPLHELEDDVASAIAAVEIEEAREDKDGNEIRGPVRKIRMADKLKALHDLAEWLKMVSPPPAPVAAPLQLDPIESARRIAFVLQAAVYVDEAPPVLSGALAPTSEPLALHQQQQPAGEDQ